MSFKEMMYEMYRTGEKNPQFIRRLNTHHYLYIDSLDAKELAKAHDSGCPYALKNKIEKVLSKCKF